MIIDSSTRSKLFSLRFPIGILGAYRWSHQPFIFNSDHYRGHPPGTLQFLESYWDGEHFEMRFAQRTNPVVLRPSNLSQEMPFAEFPSGEWTEIA